MKTPICDMLGIELPLLRLGARVRREGDAAGGCGMG
jgi:hypothetical protein